MDLGRNLHRFLNLHKHNPHVTQCLSRPQIQVDPDPDLTEIIFKVSNRAKDRFYLPRITSLSVERVLSTRVVNGGEISEMVFNVCRMPFIALPHGHQSIASQHNPV